MTKKHYIKLVELINFNSLISKSRFTKNPYYRSIFYDSFIEQLIQILEQDNPNFNKKTFIKALDIELPYINKNGKRGLVRYSNLKTIKNK